MVFRIVSLLIHTSWILFFETFFFVNNNLYVFKCQKFSASSIPGTYTVGVQSSMTFSAARYGLLQTT